MKPSRLIAAIQNFVISQSIRFKLVRNRMMKMALDNKLRHSYWGNQVLSNLNYMMAKHPNYHSEFQELVGKDKDYSKYFWASDLGYMWYKQNHTDNTPNEYFRFAVKRFEESRYTSHLDVGCGWGELSSLIATMPLATHIQGIDVAREVIDVAKKNYVSQKNLQFLVADVFEIEDRFDMVTLFGATDYILPENMGGFLQKLISIAKKEVLIVNSLRNIKLEETLTMTEAKKIIRYDVGYVQPLSYLLSSLQKDHGFEFMLQKISSDSVIAQILIK